MSVDLLVQHRHVLACARRVGTPFDQAWAAGLAVVRASRGDGHGRALVLDALEATRDAWRLAYTRQPDASPVMACRDLVDALEGHADGFAGMRVAA